MPKKMDNSTPVLDRLLEPEFISAIADLLWPITAIFTVIFFRTQIIQLFKRISKAKVLGNEFNFDVDGLESKTESALTQNMTLPSPDAIEEKKVRYSLSREVTAPSEKPSPTESILEKISLYERPIEGTIIEDIRRKTSKDPIGSLFLTCNALEISLKNLIAATGKIGPPESLSTLGRLAGWTAMEFGLSKDFVLAIRELTTIRNRVAHDYRPISENDLQRAVESGLDLLSLVQRIPRDIVYIENPSIEIFKDRNCTEPYEDIKAVTLLFAAVPGATGAKVNVPTNKSNEYIFMEQVSSEWDRQVKWPIAWMLDSEKKEGVPAWNVEKYEFCGRPIRSIFEE